MCQNPFGYLPLAITLGIATQANGLSSITASVMGLLSFTGVGQMTTLDFMSRREAYLGLFLALLVINLRNIVLSLSLSQKLEPNISLFKKLIISMGNTDEIFALTIRREGRIPADYFLGVMTIPYLSWFLGCALGSAASSFFPADLCIAMKMGLYAMLIASVIPASKGSKAIMLVASLSGALSWILKLLHQLFSDNSPIAFIRSNNFITNVIGNGLLTPSGVLIFGSLTSAAIIAKLYPVRCKEEGE